MRPLLLRVLLLSFLLSPISVLSKSGEILVVTKPYVRLLPPTVPNTALFFSLTNNGQKNLTLVKAESDVADKVELHTHIENNGVFQMRQVESIDVPEGATHAFKPGADHIMLLGLKKPLQEGQEILVKLTFSDGSSKVIYPRVKRH